MDPLEALKEGDPVDVLDLSVWSTERWVRVTFLRWVNDGQGAEIEGHGFRSVGKTNMRVPTQVARVCRRGGRGMSDDRLKQALDALVSTAVQLERWADESRRVGWSTHQVEPMCAKAAELRAVVGRLLVAYGEG